MILMAFSLGSHALVDSATLSKFIWGVDDASSGLTPTALTTQQVTAIELLVNAISRQICRHISSEIKAGTYTEVWDGAGSDDLVPSEWPINSVTSVKFSANGDFSSATALPTTVIAYDKYSIKLRDVRFPIGRGLVQVVYNAGYSTVPEDIQLACLLQFQWAYKKIGKGDAMIGLQSVSKHVGSGTESQQKDPSISASGGRGNGGLISEVVGFLEPYRRFEAPLSIMFSRVT
jgi:hypothetical protein